MTDFRALCAELVDDLELCDWPYKLKETIRADIDRARAALADEPAVPQPQPPAEGEVAELVAWLRDQDGWMGTRVIYSRIAELLQHLSPPLPVPVSERPWERDGWCDEQGRCWLRGKVEGDWRLLHPVNSGVPQLKYCFSHSLPSHTLPIPAGEVDG